MPRFIVTICDTNTGEIHSFQKRAMLEVEAILAHPWIAETYKDSYINTNFYSESPENCIQNIWSLLSWACSVVNLDQEIMNDLNGGDSSACLVTQQS